MCIRVNPCPNNVHPLAQPAQPAQLNLTFRLTGVSQLTKMLKQSFLQIAQYVFLLNKPIN